MFFSSAIVFHVNHTAANLSYFTNGTVSVFVGVGDADGITNLEMIPAVVPQVVLCLLVRELLVCLSHPEPYQEVSFYGVGYFQSPLVLS